MARAPLLDKLTFGGRVPGGVGLVLVVTVGCSLLVAFGDRHTAPLFEYGALAPAEVWRGQVFRLLTWPFIEPSPLDLLFALLFLYWFGKDLADEWGSRLFLEVYGGLALVGSIGTCLVALVDRSAMTQLFLGSWALALALTVAWGLTYPDRQILVLFVIPVRGYVIAWLTVFGTIVYSVYRGGEHYLPHLFAQGGTLVWLYRGRVASRWRRARGAARAARTKRAERAQRKTSVEYLRLVESHDDEPPPLPPELERKVDDLLKRPRRDTPS